MLTWPKVVHDFREICNFLVPLVPGLGSLLPSIRQPGEKFDSIRSSNAIRCLKSLTWSGGAGARGVRAAAAAASLAPSRCCWCPSARSAAAGRTECAPAPARGCSAPRRPRSPCCRRQNWTRLQTSIQTPPLNYHFT